MFNHPTFLKGYEGNTSIEGGIEGGGISIGEESFLLLAAAAAAQVHPVLAAPAAAAHPRHAHTQQENAHRY